MNAAILVWKVGFLGQGSRWFVLQKPAFWALDGPWPRNAPWSAGSPKATFAWPRLACGHHQAGRKPDIRCNRELGRRTLPKQTSKICRNSVYHCNAARRLQSRCNRCCTTRECLLLNYAAKTDCYMSFTLKQAKYSVGIAEHG